MVLALGLLYRRFGAVTREGRLLERVYDFARRVEQVTADEDGVRQIVQAVRELLNAERVALWLPPYLDEGPGWSWPPRTAPLVRRSGRSGRRPPPARGRGAATAASAARVVSLARADRGGRGARPARERGTSSARR